MKKRYLIPILALPMFFSFGFAVAGRNIAEVKAEEIVEPEPIVEEEEESTLDKYINEFNEKYEEIKNKQIAGTTIGGIVGGLVGAIIAFIPAVLNRANLKESRTQLNTAAENVVAIKEKYNIVDPKLDDVISVLKSSAKRLDEASKLAEKSEALIKDLEEMHKEDIELLLSVISSSPELVKNGVAEKLNKHFNRG